MAGFIAKILSMKVLMAFAEMLEKLGVKIMTTSSFQNDLDGLNITSVQWGEELVVHVEQVDLRHWQGLAHEDLQGCG